MDFDQSTVGFGLIVLQFVLSPEWVEEVLIDNAFGVRARLYICFAEKRFQNALFEEIRACARLGNLVMILLV
jgi:hypothetical protein